LFQEPASLFLFYYSKLVFIVCLIVIMYRSCFHSQKIIIYMFMNHVAFHSGQLFILYLVILFTFHLIDFHFLNGFQHVSCYCFLLTVSLIVICHRVLVPLSMWSGVQFLAHAYGENSVEKRELTLCSSQIH
jgi:hypothetical protein